MSKEKELVKVVTLVACRDKNDNKTRYEAGAEVELEKDRAEAAIAAGYAELAEPKI
jgi:hypothetical protein